MLADEDRMLLYKQNSLKNTFSNVNHFVCRVNDVARRVDSESGILRPPEAPRTKTHLF